MLPPPSARARRSGRALPPPDPGTRRGLPPPSSPQPSSTPAVETPALVASSALAAARRRPRVAARHRRTARRRRPAGVVLPRRARAVQRWLHRRRRLLRRLRLPDHVAAPRRAAAHRVHQARPLLVPARPAPAAGVVARHRDHPAGRDRGARPAVAHRSGPRRARRGHVHHQHRAGVAAERLPGLGPGAVSPAPFLVAGAGGAVLSGVAVALATGRRLPTSSPKPPSRCWSSSAGRSLSRLRSSSPTATSPGRSSASRRAPGSC